jgi:hypothetical protein
LHSWFQIRRTSWGALPEVPLPSRR